MSTAAVDETSSEKVTSPEPRPFRPEAPHCSNYTGRESFKDYTSKYCLFRWLKEVGGVTDHVLVGGG